MQQTIQLGQVAQPSVLSQVGAAVKSLKAWLSAKSETFTALCGTEGDVFTHGDVVKAHLGVLLFLLILGVAGWLEGGAA